MSRRQLIEDQLRESAGVLEATVSQANVIETVGGLLIDAFKAGNKLMTCGNGGSACDAQNFADELVGRFRRNRPALPALSLTVNSSDLTSIGNDFGFDKIFERQLEAHAKPGDVLVAISTSGISPNVLRAVEAAKKAKVKTVGLTGRTGGKLKGSVDFAVCVPSDSVARIQEAHITIIQILCELIESTLYPDAPKAH